MDISSIVWKAFRNLLVKVVASPFKMLGGLFENGGDSGLDNVAFIPGTSTLINSEQQKLDKLSKALQQKPALALNVSAFYQPESDGLALQTLRFNQLYKSAVGDETSLVQPIDYQSAVLETLYSKAFGEEKLTKLNTDSKQLLAQQATENSDSSDLSDQIDTHIEKQMLQQLIEQQTIEPSQLMDLARERAQGIYSYLTKNEATDSPLNSTRVQIEDSALKLASGVVAITCPLTLTAM